MPNISKIRKTKKAPKVAKSKLTKKTNLPAKSSPVDYYNCLLTSARNDWLDPKTGKKKKIAQCCQDCKVNAPTLNKSREQEISKLIISYHQVGESLKKLLKPIK